MVYAKRAFATVLFPSKKEGYDNYDAMRKRIEKYLEPEDYDWAFEFVCSVTNHPNYETIKKELFKTSLPMVKEEHIFLQDILNNSEYQANFLNILTELKRINSESWSISRYAIDIKMGLANDVNIMRQAGSNLYQMGTILLEEDNEIIKNAYKDFDKKLAWVKDKPYLMEFVKNKRSTLEKLIFQNYREMISIYREKTDILYRRYGFCFESELERMKEMENKVKKIGEKK